MERRLRSSICITFDQSGTLDILLADGWTVKMCNRLDDRTLEYVIEKETENESKT